MNIFFADKPKEECGVVAIFSPHEAAARKAYFALYALQHRGQESAGIAAMGDLAQGAQMRFHKQIGLVSQVFSEAVLADLEGHMAIGHNRYATSGSKTVANAGPYVFNTIDGMLALAHNGNIVNARELKQSLLQRGVALTSNTDSELLALLLAAPTTSQNVAGDLWIPRLESLLRQVQGAFSVTILTETAVYAVRDPLGLRPLCLGQLPPPAELTDTSIVNQNHGYVIASESCALDTLGAQFVRDISPGEIIRIDAQGVHSFSALPNASSNPQALCIFEYVYFARPDSQVEGRSVHATRQALGRQMAIESPELTAQAVDLVIPVPDSSIPAALGFAHQSKIPYSEGFTKSRYIGRTFIAPDQTLRQLGVRLKFNPLASNVAGKRLVLIDDSIVRGNTIAPLIASLRRAGAREVHVRVSSPPIQHPCFMGVDMATPQELIANQVPLEKMAAHVGADSLRYLSLAGMVDVVRAQASDQSHFCTACFSGNYPLDVSQWLSHNRSPMRPNAV